jgi:large subunit ribosomal protein L21
MQSLQEFRPSIPPSFTQRFLKPASFNDALILDTFSAAMINTHVLLTRRKTHMYAIIETGGKQYRVETGTVLQVESLPGDVGHSVQIDKVKLLHGEGGLVVGQPVVAGATVTAEIIRQGRTRSITVFKKHRRKNYRRTRGHRQGFTQLRVTGIETK